MILKSLKRSNSSLFGCISYYKKACLSSRFFVCIFGRSIRFLSIVIIMFSIFFFGCIQSRLLIWVTVLLLRFLRCRNIFFVVCPSVLFLTSCYYHRIEWFRKLDTFISNYIFKKYKSVIFWCLKSIIYVPVYFTLKITQFFGILF